MDNDEMHDRYRETRSTSLELCRPLKIEDYRIQSMPDVSPPWWNLGHTTWFFAKNILEPYDRHLPEDSRYEYVLNSYYEALGPRIPRDQRGLVTRPTTEEIYRFRESVDERMERLIADADDHELERLDFLLTTGIHHEQQHQELLVTEVKHILGFNVPDLREPYSATADHGTERIPTAEFIGMEGGLRAFGNLEGGWCWDNELPVHKAYLDDFAILNRLVTNGEYLDFIKDGGYSNPLLWLSNGWSQVKEQGWSAPLYWEQFDGEWLVWTLSGTKKLSLDEPVCHVSFYEADAFARWKSSADEGWAGARLPTEREWEHAARCGSFETSEANFLESEVYHPRGVNGVDDGPVFQLAGEVWEWTSNHYEPYPGYAPFDGNLMEYNGKFMDNQRVLRGGSCATPGSHIRLSYRNFWPAETRFQFSGIRLAKSIERVQGGVPRALGEG